MPPRCPFANATTYDPKRMVDAQLDESTDETEPKPGARVLWLAAGLIVAAFIGVGAVYISNSRVEDPPPVTATVATGTRDVVTPNLELTMPDPRSVEPYRGYGTWVDVFDFDPAYSPPTVDAADIAEMADLGVGTLYLQVARLDDRTPDGLVDPWLLTEMVLTAHAEGIDVVAWYLPRFEATTEDVDRVVAMSEFEVLGERFDGIGVDIEWIGPDRAGNPIDDETRTSRLLSLSDTLERSIDGPLAAIVPPPVQMEVINTSFWPGFPWSDLALTYDVWMPMSYWSFRSDSSGYGEGYTYHKESTRRLRDNVGDPAALVHGIGGIGGLDGIDDPPDPPEPLATLEEVERFVLALDDTGSIGGSIYDWNTLEPLVRTRLAELFISVPSG